MRRVWVWKGDHTPDHFIMVLVDLGDVFMGVTFGGWLVEDWKVENVNSQFWERVA